MNTKTILKNHRLVPRNSQAKEMIVVGHFALWFLLIAFLYTA
ncbi:uncharacterized protein METZ01_LOCUS116103 [marine metagenome]|jgi:hypothetical protein|uniref:Uncharacterized protein n=1 Tax=marine metagenome TaxID=408172 RepID=A0A381XER9_9ZZZZ